MWFVGMFTSTTLKTSDYRLHMVVYDFMPQLVRLLGEPVRLLGEGAGKVLQESNLLQCLENQYSSHSTVIKHSLLITRDSYPTVHEVTLLTFHKNINPVCKCAHIDTFCKSGAVTYPNRAVSFELY